MGGTLTATVTVGSSTIAGLAGSGALSAVARQQFPGTPALAGSGSLVAAVIPQAQSSGVLAGSGALVCALKQVYTAIPGSLTGSGALTCTAAPLFSRAAALSGGGALTATAAPPGPAFDTVDAGADSSGANTSLVWSSTAAAGSDVFIFYTCHSAGTPSPTVTYDGSASGITLVGTSVITANSLTQIYRKAAVAGGTKTIQIGNLSTDCAADSISIKNVTSVGTPTSVGTTTSQNVTCSPQQLIIQSFGSPRAEDISAYSGGTGRILMNFGGTAGAGVLTISTAIATTTFGCTVGTISRLVGMAVVLS